MPDRERSSRGVALALILIAATGAEIQADTRPGFSSGNPDLLIPQFVGRPALGERLLVDMMPGGEISTSTYRTSEAMAPRFGLSTSTSPVQLLDRQGNSGPSSSLTARQKIRRGALRRYLLSDLGTLGGSQSFAYGINQSGQVVGYSWIEGDLAGHAFLYSAGRMKDLFPLNSGVITTVGPIAINRAGQIASGLVAHDIYVPAILDSATGATVLTGSLGGMTAWGFNGVAQGINDAGQAVGYSYIDGTTRHAFRFRDGVLTDIDRTGGFSAANAINSSGRIVGFFGSSNSGIAHAYIYEDGVMKNIGGFSRPNLSGSESYARDINNRGQVVGEFQTVDKKAIHGFLYKAGVFTDIGAFNSPETSAFAINDRGEIVGTTYIPYQDVCFDESQQKNLPCTKYKPHGFLHIQGRMADLNDLLQPEAGWEITWAFDINRRGQVVGYGRVREVFHAYLLTPAVGRGQCVRNAWQAFPGLASESACLRYISGRR